MMRAFISYSGVDRHVAGAVKDALEELGIDGFLAHENIQVSEEWKERLLEELRAVNVFVAILSTDFKKSEWCDHEIGFIVSRTDDVVIIPLCIDDTRPYGFISHIQGVSIPDPFLLPGVLQGVLLRKRPVEIIPTQIELIGRAKSFRHAEALMFPLAPYFKRLSKKQIANLISSALANGQVREASLCKKEYFPRLLRDCARKISPAMKAQLLEVIMRP